MEKLLLKPILNRQQEQEFFKLAANMLQCLWHEIHIPGDKMFFFLGYMDYAVEMDLVLKEFRNDNKVIQRSKISIRL